MALLGTTDFLTVFLITFYLKGNTKNFKLPPKIRASLLKETAKKSKPRNWFAQ